MLPVLPGFLFVACLLFAGNEAGWAIAEFEGDNGVEGYVLSGNGYVFVELDISGVSSNNYSAIGGPSCFEDGFLFHIHELWEYNDSNDKLGSLACGSQFTGGHWDPWLACGAATGNQYCATKGGIGCVNGSSVLGNKGYDCDSHTFNRNPYVCEVGDWSGKYGNAYVNTSHDIVTASGYSPFEVDGGDLLNFSVVFHCSSDESSAFCAPFENLTLNSNASADIERPIQGKIYFTLNTNTNWLTAQKSDQKIE